MNFLKFLVTTICLFITPLNASIDANSSNHTEIVEQFEILQSPSCSTKINMFKGSCIKPSECEGGVYNNLCPGSFKCCVKDVNSAPWLYWRHVSKDEFKSMFPLVSSTRVDTLYPWFNDALGDVLADKKGNDACNIITAFTAQVGHESLDLTTFEEFASGEAYEGRCSGLGNCNKGDGVKYKGRGAIQVTGKSNYGKVSSYLGTDFLTQPDLMVLPSYGFKASVWYWVTNNLNKYCTGKASDFVDLTKKINGGTNGLEDRQRRWLLAKNVMKC